MDDDGPHPPSGLSLICGSENEDILQTMSMGADQIQNFVSARM